MVNNFEFFSASMQIDHDCSGWRVVDILILNTQMTLLLDLSWGWTCLAKEQKANWFYLQLRLTLGSCPLELRGLECCPCHCKYCTARKIYGTLHGQMQKQGFLCIYWKLCMAKVQVGAESKKFQKWLVDYGFGCSCKKFSLNTSTICFYAFAAFRLSSVVSLRRLFEFSTVWKNCRV